MEEENILEEVEQESHFSKVTPFSKYLALVLFIALPFIGGWIGYNYAPEKVVEVEKVIKVEKIVEEKEQKEAQETEWLTYNSEWIEFNYPSNFIANKLHRNEGQGSAVSFVDKDNEGKVFNLEIYPGNPGRLSIEEWTNQQEWPFLNHWTEHLAIVSLNGRGALQSKQTDSIFFTQGVYIYKLAQGLTLDATLLHEEEFAKIISSLKLKPVD